ncbi:FkbM family methyltransferase [Rhizorhabdus argentea]|uniref:FkbM family methyltransferase n=1 Tax=Rhizorhabdus argentea TaxID=1387174 RepID=UPI0030EE7481
MKGISSLANDFLAKLGYSVTAQWRQPNLALATLTRQVIEAHAIDLIVDVGANIGQYRQFLRFEAGFDGDIVSFEPQPELAIILDDAARADERWTVQHCGLGSEDGELTFNVMEGSQFSSFLEPDNGAFHQFDEQNQIKARHLVPVKRLDRALSGVEGRNIFLKSDTQGFDVQVVRGATGILHRVQALQMELPIHAIYKGVQNYRDTLSELEQLGFTPAGFFVVSHDRKLAGIEFDCLLVRGDPKA